MSCGSLDGRGVWGRMDTCICMAESLCCPPETITILLIGYTSIQNKKFNKKRKGVLCIDSFLKISTVTNMLFTYHLFTCMIPVSPTLSVPSD